MRELRRKCSLCGKEAVVYIPYQRRYYCKEHFIEFLVNKVRSTIKRYKLIRSRDKVLVALSGGKDSAVLLDILLKLSSYFNFKLAAVHIDLGIGNFSDESREIVKEQTKRLGVNLVIVAVNEILGIDLTELSRKARRPPCSTCGLVKRYLLNLVALTSGASKLALGHNADDIMAYSFKSFLTQDLRYISKLGAFTESIERLAVGRIRPLYEVYEFETKLYARLLDIPVVKSRCPHFRPNQMEIELKKIINDIEQERPGMKLSFLRKFMRNLKEYPEIKGRIVPCKYCGMISSTGECSFCRITRKVFGKPMGSKVKEYMNKLLKDKILWYS